MAPPRCGCRLPRPDRCDRAVADHAGERIDRRRRHGHRHRHGRTRALRRLPARPGDRGAARYHAGRRAVGRAGRETAGPGRRDGGGGAAARDPRQPDAEARRADPRGADRQPAGRPRRRKPRHRAQPPRSRRTDRTGELRPHQGAPRPRHPPAAARQGLRVRCRREELCRRSSVSGKAAGAAAIGRRGGGADHHHAGGTARRHAHAAGAQSCRGAIGARRADGPRARWWPADQLHAAARADAEARRPRGAGRQRRLVEARGGCRRILPRPRRGRSARHRERHGADRVEGAAGGEGRPLPRRIDVRPRADRQAEPRPDD